MATYIILIDHWDTFVCMWIAYSIFFLSFLSLFLFFFFGLEEFFTYFEYKFLIKYMGFPGGSVVKNWPVMQT